MLEIKETLIKKETNVKMDSFQLILKRYDDIGVFDIWIASFILSVEKCDNQFLQINLNFFNLKSN